MAFVSSSSLTLHQSSTSASSFLCTRTHSSINGFGNQRLSHVNQRNASSSLSMSTPAPATSGGPKRTTEADTPQKEFLTRLKALGRVRLVVRNPVGILECVGTFKSLFFASIPSGEYANLIEPSQNLDMHLLLSGFTGVKFEIGKSRSKVPAPLYSLRLYGDDKETVALSVFVMWDKEPTDVEPERIDAWKKLKADYIKDGESDTFFF